jgi:hypothetical protein
LPISFKFEAGSIPLNLTHELNELAFIYGQIGNPNKNPGNPNKKK